MPLYKTATETLNRQVPLELELEIDSFAGGENTVGSDKELKNNEARTINNWDINSLGGMIRAKGLTKVADNIAIYTGALDLVIYHFEGTTTKEFVICDGNLLVKSAATFALDNAGDAAAFTSGKLSGAVSAGSALWITNTSDGLKRKVIGGAVAAPAGVPGTNGERIYEHVFRLISEGNGKTIYGSRSGSGNWTAADAWSATNDAWSITMPDNTYGCVPGFPSGPELTAFTHFNTYVISNQPNITRRDIINGIGCWNGFTIARGNEGVFLFSNYPTLGIFLWDGTQFVNLTINNDFVKNISLTNRMYGVYRNNRYFFIYNESGSGVTYPNRIKMYDAKFGRWMTRPIHSGVGDNLGYPTLLTKDNNELYVGSSRVCKMYELEDSSTSDNGNDTQASYTTKNFTSKDFGCPFDDVRMKLIKITALYKGTVGALGIAWTADRGKRTGSITFDTTASGDLINTTFIVNTSSILSNVPDKLSTKSLSNAAVGREFNFQIINNATGSLTEFRRMKVCAVAMEEF